MLGGARHSGGIRDVDDNIRTLDDIERNVTHALAHARPITPRAITAVPAHFVLSGPAGVRMKAASRDSSFILRNYNLNSRI
jgi:hypothetical protein